jgi:hypothetical protein
VPPLGAGAVPPVKVLLVAVWASPVWSSDRFADGRRGSVAVF